MGRSRNGEEQEMVSMNLWLCSWDFISRLATAIGLKIYLVVDTYYENTCAKFHFILRFCFNFKINLKRLYLYFVYPSGKDQWG